jgi:hypothetical protein
MRIFNNFKPKKLFTYNNIEFPSICSSNSLTNINIKIIDESFEPVRFTNLIFIYISLIDTSNKDLELPCDMNLKEKNKFNRLMSKNKKEIGLKNFIKYDKQVIDKMKI